MDHVRSVCEIVWGHVSKGASFAFVGRAHDSRIVRATVGSVYRAGMKPLAWGAVGTASGGWLAVERSWAPLGGIEISIEISADPQKRC